jgi:hypothetical protein
MSDAWAELNHRQRAYLRALYDCDQAKEAERRQRAARGDWFDRTPASEWRWVTYGPVAPPSALYTALRSANLVDPGTGATWQALEDRGLCQCRYPRDALGVQLLEVQITPKGRKAVRAATGEQRQQPAPKGQLRERQWAALARLYAAGDAGVLSEEMMYGRGGFDWARTLLRLRDYKPQPLMEEFHDPEVYTIARMRLTPFGRDYYRREWARYNALYPDVEAARPTEDAPADA